MFFSILFRSPHALFDRRSVIENVWNTLKELINMVYIFSREVSVFLALLILYRHLSVEESV